MNTIPSAPVPPPLDSHGEQVPRRVSAETALQSLVVTRASSEGLPDLLSLARRVAETFNVTSAVLVRREALRPLAVWSRGQAHEPSAPAPCGTLLEQVFARGLHHCARDAGASRPEDDWPRQLGRCGFLGMTLKSTGGEVLGAIALYDDEPLEVGPSDLALLDVFALRAGAALERSGEHLRSLTRDFLLNLLDTLPVPILIKDRQHRYVLINEAFCRFMGLARDKLLYKSDDDFMPPEEANILLEHDEQAFSSGQARENEATFTDRVTGQPRTIFTQKTAFMGQDGHPRLVCVIRDITEYKHQLTRDIHELTRDITQYEHELAGVVVRLKTLRKEERSFREIPRLSQATPFMSAEGHPHLVHVIRDSAEYKHELAGVAERLATLRRLALDVTTQLSNPMAFVLASLRFLRYDLARPDAMAVDLTELRETVGDMLEGAERVEAILRAFTTFVREREGEE